MISAVKKRQTVWNFAPHRRLFQKKGLTFGMKSCIISLVAAKVVNIAG